VRSVEIATPRSTAICSGDLPRPSHMRQHGGELGLICFFDQPGTSRPVGRDRCEGAAVANARARGVVVVQTIVDEV
jgi:hypothetical protein